MTYEADEELLSAYLDGELTAAEQARVEQLLAEVPSYRQLYEELRAVRTSCEALPPHRLPADFSRHVLREAERAVLRPHQNGDATSSGAAAPAESSKSTSTGPSPSGVERSDDHVELPRLRWPRGWRPWLWPALATAAALLMMVFNKEHQPAHRDLADAVPRMPSDLSIGAAPETAPDAKVSGEKQADAEEKLPERQQLGREVLDHRAAAKVAKDQSNEEDIRSDGLRAEQAKRSSVPGDALERAESPNESDAKGLAGNRSIEKFAAKSVARDDTTASQLPAIASDRSEQDSGNFGGFPRDGGPVADKAGQATTPGGRGALAKSAGGQGGAAGNKFGITTEGNNDQTSERGNAAAGGPLGEGQPRAARLGAPITAQAVAGLGDGVARNGAFGSSAYSNGVLVVECEIQPAAAEAGAFETLLLRNDLALQNTAQSPPTTTSPRGRGANGLANTAIIPQDGERMKKMRRKAEAAAEPADATDEQAPQPFAAQKPAPRQPVAQPPATLPPAAPAIAAKAPAAADQTLQLNAADAAPVAAAPGAAPAADGPPAATVPAAALPDSLATPAPLVYMVEGTRQQIEATLADLNAHSDEYPAVWVQPAAQSPDQQGLTMYSYRQTDSLRDNSLANDSKEAAPVADESNLRIQQHATGSLADEARQSANQPSVAIEQQVQVNSAPAKSGRQAANDAPSQANLAAAAPANAPAQAAGAPNAASRSQARGMQNNSIGQRALPAPGGPAQNTARNTRPGLANSAARPADQFRNLNGQLDGRAGNSANNNSIAGKPATGGATNGEQTAEKQHVQQQAAGKPLANNAASEPRGEDSANEAERLRVLFILQVAPANSITGPSAPAEAPPAVAAEPAQSVPSSPPATQQQP